MNTVWLLLVFSLCASPMLASTPAQELAKVKAKVMAADYRADLPELARLRDELAQWPNDRELAYLARYWSGFASWRIAINGANHAMKSDELTTNLKNAGADFYASLKLKDDFADSYAAASSVNGWLAAFAQGANDTAGTKERVYLAVHLLARAEALEPKNPRVLWVKGGFFLFRPAALGGSIPRAIEIYKEMLKEADRHPGDAASPFPDWGKPEALMSLAFAHSMLTPPDLATARDEAQAALKLEPEWSYVRDNLIPRLAPPPTP